MPRMPRIENIELVKKSNARDAAIPGFGLLFASVVTLSLGVLLLLAHYLF